MIPFNVSVFWAETMAWGPNSDIHAHRVSSDPREKEIGAEAIAGQRDTDSITSWGFCCEPSFHCPTFLEGVMKEVKDGPDLLRDSSLSPLAAPIRGKHFKLAYIGEGNGTPLQYSCLENPRDGGAWWAAVYGVAQSRTRLKWLSSSRYRLFVRVEFLIS